MSPGDEIDWVARSVLEPGSYFEPLWWRFPTDGGEPELLTQRHGEFDGVGWLAHLIRERYGVSIHPLPSMPGARPAPPLWRLAVPALHCARNLWLKPSSARWRRFDPAANALHADGNPLCRGWMLLSAEETRRLGELARARRGSANALVLWGVNQALAGSTIPGSGPMIWSLPVNMRGCVALKNPYANHVSGIEVATSPEAGPTEIHEAILLAFRREEHWVTWTALNLGRWIGRIGPRVFAWIALRESRRLTGTFSNLGAWPPAGVLLPNPDRAWCCTSIVRPERPIGVGVLTWQGRLALGLLAHPSVSTDPADARRWLETSKERIFQQETGARPNG